MNRPSLFCPWLLLALATVLTPLSCSAPKPQDATVKGQVTLGGTPLSSGIVTFVSNAGFGGSSPLRADGTFELPLPVPPGDYHVCVSPPAGQQAGSTIPTIYQLPTTTKIVQTLSAGPNDVVVTLSASPEEPASGPFGASVPATPPPAAAQ